MNKISFLNDLGKINKAYRDSYEEVDRKKVSMYNAQAKADAYKNLIHDGKLSQSQRIQLARELGIKDTSDNALIQGLNKFSGTAEKQYETAKAKHDEYKKMNPKAAELEDAFDYYDKMYSGAGNISDAPIVPGINYSTSNSSSGNSGSGNSSSGNSGSGNSSSGNSSSGNSGSGNPSMPEASGPAKNIEEQNNQDKEVRKQQIETEIEELKNKLKKQEDSINKNIEKSEELISLYEKSIFNETDDNMKAYYKSLIEVQTGKIDSWKKELEKFKNDTEKRLDVLRSEIRILSE